jgi:hypothetical protein
MTKKAMELLAAFIGLPYLVRVDWINSMGSNIGKPAFKLFPVAKTSDKPDPALRGELVNLLKWAKLQTYNTISVLTPDGIIMQISRQVNGAWTEWIKVDAVSAAQLADENITF